METTLYLIRHGVTDWNHDGRAQGHSDLPLNREGRIQAQNVAARLAPEPWDALYSSPLRRAAQTAEAIAQAVGLTIHKEPRLMERNIGIAEGTTRQDREILWPGIDWRTLPGGEEDEALVQRATQVLEEIARRQQGKRILCVTHGGLIYTFLHSLPQASPSLLPRVIQNTAIAQVVWDGSHFHVRQPLDYRHLLEDGIEFTGEKGRLRGAPVSQLLDSTLSPSGLEQALTRATVVESAWHQNRLVGLARAFTDGVLTGYIDVATALPEYETVIPRLIARIQERYPNVDFTRLPRPSQGLTGGESSA